jgi:hypothetical protein
LIGSDAAFYTGEGEAGRIFLGWLANDSILKAYLPSLIVRCSGSGKRLEVKMHKCFGKRIERFQLGGTKISSKMAGVTRNG